MSRSCQALVLFTASLLVGCGATPKTSLPATPTPVVGSLAGASATIDFGSIAVGSSATQTGTLTASASTVTISSASWNGEGFSLSGIVFPLTLSAGQSVPFTVTFSPEASGTASGSISFISNASDSPTRQTLKGNGIETEVRSVTLLWDPSPSQVIGYNLYRGVNSGGPYSAKLNSSVQPGTSFVDNTVSPGITYYYVATAVDQDSVESSYSNEIVAAIP